MVSLALKSKPRIIRINLVIFYKHWILNIPFLYLQLIIFLNLSLYFKIKFKYLLLFAPMQTGVFFFYFSSRSITNRRQETFLSKLCNKFECRPPKIFLTKKIFYLHFLLYSQQTLLLY